MSPKPDPRTPERPNPPVMAAGSIRLGRLLLLGAAFLAACLSGCKSERKEGTVLAQVGNASLTLEELRESFPAEYEQLIRREQYLDFIKRWIDDEVLYQQAVKGRLDDDPQVKRKLEKLARKALIEEFLARENPGEAFEPDEMAMGQYYEMNKENFRRKAPEVKYVHIRVAAAKQAADLRWRVQNDNAFLAQAATHSLDPVPESMASLPFKKLTELPPCLAPEVSAARIGTTTNPIACPDGVYLVRILERQEAGSLIPFAEAKEEIGATLQMQRKDRLLENRVAQYKEGIAISYNLDQIPGLSEAPAAGMAGTAPAPADTQAAAAAAQSAEAGLVPEAPEVPAFRPEDSEPAPRPKRRRPRPAPPAAAPAASPVTPAAEPAAPAAAPAQEENANVQKTDAPPQ